MIHPDDDKLLDYALEIHSDELSDIEITDHLAACPGCRTRLENLRRDIDIIGGIRPNRPMLTMTTPRRLSDLLYQAVRVAALILLGMAVGYSASNWIHNRSALVSPAYITLSPPPDSLGNCPVPDAMELSQAYYENILNRTK